MGAVTARHPVGGRSGRRRRECRPTPTSFLGDMLRTCDSRHAGKRAGSVKPSTVAPRPAGVCRDLGPQGRRFRTRARAAAAIIDGYGRLRWCPVAVRAMIASPE